MKATMLYREIASMIKALPEKDLKAVKVAFKAKGPRGARAVLQKIKPINDKLMDLREVGMGKPPTGEKRSKGWAKAKVKAPAKDAEGYEVIAKATEGEK